MNFDLQWVDIEIKIKDTRREINSDWQMFLGGFVMNCPSDERLFSDVSVDTSAGPSQVWIHGRFFHSFNTSMGSDCYFPRLKGCKTTFKLFISIQLRSFKSDETENKYC